jgi:hypothetical protein
LVQLLGLGDAWSEEPAVSLDRSARRIDAEVGKVRKRRSRTMIIRLITIASTLGTLTGNFALAAEPLAGTCQ